MTLTGIAAEQLLIPIFDLLQDKYVVRSNWPIPPRQGCHYSRLEWMLFPDFGGKIGIEVQTQNRQGSAERRVTDKMKMLSNIAKAFPKEFQKFYIVLIGDGFRELDRYLDVEFKRSINVGDEVEVVTINTFFTRAAQLQL